MSHSVDPSASEAGLDDAPQRLQRILSSFGVASRRASEALILEGRVSLNGRVVRELGTKANPYRDTIRVDGHLVRPPAMRYILLNKPKNTITTASDERGRRTVMDFVDVKERIYPVGRLDRDTEGLMLLTNDGDLANRIMHPSYVIDKEYEVTTTGRPTAAAMARLQNGIELDGKLVVPSSCRIARQEKDAFVIKMTVHEGLNRMVRRMMEKAEIPVTGLRRTRLGPLSVAGIASGSWRDLRSGELNSLFEAVGRHDQA